MKIKPDVWAENLYDWIEARIKLVIEKKTQIFQILVALVIFTVSAASLQYVPFFVKWFHINDRFFGEILVYSLPLWIAFAVFLIWRS